MPFCTQCGAQLEEGAKFCTNCGARQPDAVAPTYTPPAAPAGAPQGAPSYTYDPTIYGGKDGGIGSSGNSGKKKGGKIVFIILAVLAVIAALAYVFATKLGGGSGKDVDDAALGLYTAQKAEASGMSISIQSMWKNGFTVELKDKGKAELNVDGTKGSAKWTLDGENINIQGSGVDLSGTLKDGVLTLEDVMGTGVRLYFTKDGASLPEAEYGWWNGDWYGWWTVYDAGGVYLEDGYANHAWDVCATIEVNGEEGSIDIWDEDGDSVAWADLRFGPGASDKGCMTSTDGKFYNKQIEQSEWIADPAVGMMSEFDQFICIHGFYAQPSNAENWIEYYIFLRPWGMKWDDVENGDLSNMIYDSMMPNNYENWYLPLIESGAGMPAEFEGLD